MRPSLRVAARDAELWTYEGILSWVGDTFARAVASGDAIVVAKNIWRDLAEKEKHFPISMRRKFAATMDEKLHALGSPTLKELAQML